MLGTDKYLEDGGLYYGVFEGSALQSVRLPSTLRRIEYDVFKDCTELAGIRLPGALREIGEHALQCKSLRVVEVEEDCTADVRGHVPDSAAIVFVHSSKD